MSSKVYIATVEGVILGVFDSLSAAHAAIEQDATEDMLEWHGVRANIDDYEVARYIEENPYRITEHKVES